MTNKEQLDIYLNDLKEGDNITITADFLNTLKGVSNDLKAIELYAYNFIKNIGEIIND